MGYLINPIAFRIGQTQQWEDIWFSYKNYYPDFLHFVLKIRLFLNSILSSFPEMQDWIKILRFKKAIFRNGVFVILDDAVIEEKAPENKFVYSKNEDIQHVFKFPSLFKEAILYSHFRINFNLHTVFIALFVYPGKFWESLLDPIFKWRRFAGLFSKSLYWQRKVKQKHKLIYSSNFQRAAYNQARNVLRHSNPTNIFLYNLKANDSRRENLEKLYYSSPYRWERYTFAKSRKTNFDGDRRWFIYKRAKRSFFWKNKNGLHFFLLFFLFFKPFNVISNLKSLFFKNFERMSFNFNKSFNFSGFFIKIFSKFSTNLKLSSLLSANFFFILIEAFFFLVRLVPLV